MATGPTSAADRLMLSTWGRCTFCLEEVIAANALDGSYYSRPSYCIGLLGPLSPRGRGARPPCAHHFYDQLVCIRQAHHAEARRLAKPRLEGSLPYQSLRACEVPNHRRCKDETCRVVHSSEKEHATASGDPKGHVASLRDYGRGDVLPRSLSRPETAQHGPRPRHRPDAAHLAHAWWAVAACAGRRLRHDPEDHPPGAAGDGRTKRRVPLRAGRESAVS